MPNEMRPGAVAALAAFSLIAAVALVGTLAIMWEMRRQWRDARARDQEQRRQTSALRDELHGLRGHVDAMLAWSGLPAAPATAESDEDEPTTPINPRQQERRLRIIKGELGLAALGALLFRWWTEHPVRMSMGSTALAAAAVGSLLWSILSLPTDHVSHHAQPPTTRTSTSTVTVTTTVTAPSSTGGGAPPPVNRVVRAPRGGGTTQGRAMAVAAQEIGPTGTHATRTRAGTRPPRSGRPTRTSTRATTTNSPPTSLTAPAPPSPPHCGVAATVLVLQIGILCG